MNKIPDKQTQDWLNENFPKRVKYELDLELFRETWKNISKDS